jgi:hypothetical protein
MTSGATPKDSALAQLERILRVITPIGAVAVFLAGIIQYTDTKDDEFRRTVWEARYAIYKDVMASAGAVVHTRDSASRQSAQLDFERTYHGHVHLLEDEHVYTAMRVFDESMTRAIWPDSFEVLQQKCRLIGLACRKSLQETWEPVSMHAVRELEK